MVCRPKQPYPSPDVRPEYGITTTQSAEWHGNSGPVVKSYPTNFNALHIHITDALETLGVPKNPEPVRSHANTPCSMYVVSQDVQSDGINVGSVTTFAAVDPRTATRSYSANVSSTFLWACVYASSLSTLLPRLILSLTPAETTLSSPQAPWFRESFSVQSPLRF